jgi:hypothetical protein
VSSFHLIVHGEPHLADAAILALDDREIAGSAKTYSR